jgi:hypothetical protein
MQLACNNFLFPEVICERAGLLKFNSLLLRFVKNNIRFIHFVESTG